jgi:hypothetical protein
VMIVSLYQHKDVPHPKHELRRQAAPAIAGVFSATFLAEYATQMTAGDGSRAAEDSPARVNWLAVCVSPGLAHASGF